MIDFFISMFDRMGGHDWGLVGLSIRTSFLLLPFCFLAGLFVNRERAFYTFLWIQFAWVSLLGLLFGVQLFLSARAPGFGGIFGVFLIIICGAILLLTYFRRPKATAFSPRTIFAMLTITLVLNFAVNQIIGFSHYKQSVMMQVMDVDGKPIERAKLDGVGSTNSMGRLWWDVSISTENGGAFHTHNYTLRKSGYQSIDIELKAVKNTAVASSLLKRISKERDEGIENEYVSLSYSITRTERMPDGFLEHHDVELLSERVMPPADKHVFTVIMPRENDMSLPDYSRQLFGALLSDYNDPKLNVESVMVSEEELDSPSIYGKLIAKRRFRNSTGSEMLDLSHTPVTGPQLVRILAGIKDMPLHNLNLSHTAINDETLNAIPVTNAQQMNLSYTGVTTAGLNTLWKHPSLFIVAVDGLNATCADGRPPGRRMGRSVCYFPRR